MPKTRKYMRPTRKHTPLTKKRQTCAKKGGFIGTMYNRIKTLYKTTKKRFTKRMINNDKTYVNKYDIHNIVNVSVYNVLKKKNINNAKKTKLILEKIRESDLFSDLYDNEIFIKKIHDLIIIRDFSVLDKLFDDADTMGRFHKVYAMINELEKKKMLIILFSTDDYRNTNNSLVPIIEKVFDY
jgi:hypothetical protein